MTRFWSENFCWSLTFSIKLEPQRSVIPMIRKIIRIDEIRCNRYRACAARLPWRGNPNLVDRKSKLIRDGYRDGPGNCPPICPTDWEQRHNCWGCNHCFVKRAAEIPCLFTEKAWLFSQKKRLRRWGGFLYFSPWSRTNSIACFPVMCSMESAIIHNLEYSRSISDCRAASSSSGE